MSPDSFNKEIPGKDEGADQRGIIAWLATGGFLIFLMVIIGGVTRLTHSGLSITEWNLLMGTLPPFTNEQWLELFEKYKQTPEFRQIHYLFTISDFKTIFWWEYSHRLLGRLIGIVFIVPFFFFLLKKKISKELLPKLIFIFLLGAIQGFLGWYMVKSGLVDIPSVNHYRLAAHLITAFATFGFIFWLILDLSSENPIGNGEKISQKKGSYGWFRGIVYCLFFLVIVQIIYGAFVAGLKAGLLYPTFPGMGDEWIAGEIKLSFTEKGWLSFFSEGASVQFIHRWLGTLILFAFTALWLISKKMELAYEIMMPVKVLVIIVLLQFLLGYFTLIKSVPLFYALLHQAGAFVLFGGMLFLIHRLRHN